MRVVSVVGTRPQFVKAAPVSRALAGAGMEEVWVHTGQHYDEALSAAFFRDLALPRAVNLGVGSGPHGRQTGRMLTRMAAFLSEVRPRAVLVYGDTNSALAGALAAVRAGVFLAHVESGLRSWDRGMPEEVNRRVADRLSDLLFCPTQTAVANLAREGMVRGVHQVGDPMLDAARLFAPEEDEAARELEALGLSPGAYVLATVHRPANTDNPEVLARLLGVFAALGVPVLLPLHPRTEKAVAALPEAVRRGFSQGGLGGLRMVPPRGYRGMLALVRHARAVATDSGGVQREAFFSGVPSVVLRKETEWPETVEAGWCVLAGTEPARVAEALGAARPPEGTPPPLFGSGHAAARIARILAERLG